VQSASSPATATARAECGDRAVARSLIKPALPVVGIGQGFLT
jgi:hypothetical protein